jgi:LCP family protein required for cell wall assembly
MTLTATREPTAASSAAKTVTEALGAQVHNRSRRGPRAAVWLTRGVIAVVSLLVLSLTGYAWATARTANNGLNRENVISANGGGAKPADGSLDVLLVGMDSRTDAKGNVLPADQLARLHAGPDQGEIDTDTMMLIHIPNGGGRAVGISIPRDSWVNIPGVGLGKINSAYGIAKNAALNQDRAAGRTDAAQLQVDSDAAGARASIRVVEALTGVTIDHFASVNLEGFYQISNAIGGVAVCLLHAVDDRQWSGAVFPAGQFTVQGIQALEFVRQRHNIPGGSTDLEREQRQQAFLASMAHKILSGGVLTSPGRLSGLIGAIQGAVTIDSGWDLLGFAQEMSGMTSGNIRFQTIPTVSIDYTPQPGVSAVEINPAQVQAFVKNSETPPGSAPATSTPAAPAETTTSHNAAITVSAHNATARPGLAAEVLNVLTSEGFGNGGTGNATHRSSSVIYYPAGQEADAQAVSSALGGGFTLAEGSSVASGSVAVYLGSSYHGPTSASSVSSSVSSSASSSAAGSAPTSTAPPAGSTPAISDSGGAPCVN